MKILFVSAFALAALVGFTASAAFASPLTERQQAAIREEVGEAMKGFIVACERIDLGETLKFEADIPEFRFADTDGQLYDYPTFKKNLTDLFAGCSAQKIFTRRQEITVLGPDIALVAWHGAIELTQKDGTALRSDPYNGTFLFRRFGDAWKIAYQHESGPAPQPVGPMTSDEEQLRRTDAELVAAANAHDRERWLACFEPDAKLLPPGGSPLTGKESIRKFATVVMSNPDFAVAHKIELIEVSPARDTGWVSYAFELTVRGEDGRPAVEMGTDVTLYRKGADGKWRVLLDAWSPHKATTGGVALAVTALLDDYFLAVETRDAAKFLRLFAENADLTVFENNELRFTHRELAEFVAGFFKDYTDLRATWEKRAVQELSPTAAVVTGTFKVEAKDAKGAPVAFRNAFTFVLVKPADRWLVQHVHESSLAP